MEYVKDFIICVLISCIFIVLYFMYVVVKYELTENKNKTYFKLLKPKNWRQNNDR